MRKVLWLFFVFLQFGGISLFAQLPNESQTAPPELMVNALPGVCKEGDRIYNITTHLAMRCNQNGVWVQAGGGGGVAPFNTEQCKPSFLPGTLTIASPCGHWANNQGYALSANATCTSVSGTFSVFVYRDKNGVLTAGYQTGSPTCANITLATGITAYPPESFPIATFTLNSGSFTAILSDDRPSFYYMPEVAGACILLTYSNGVRTISAGCQPSGGYVNSNGTNFGIFQQIDALPDSATWSAVGSTTTNTVVAGHAEKLFEAAPGGSNGDQLGGIQDSRTLGSSAFTLTAAFTCKGQNGFARGGCGIAISHGAQFITLMMLGDASNHWYLSVDRWTNNTTWSANAIQYLAVPLAVWYVQISLATGTFTYKLSIDGGRTYDTFLSESSTAFFADNNGMKADFVVNATWTQQSGAGVLWNWNEQ